MTSVDMNSKVEVIPALEMCILTTACYKHATGCFMEPSQQYLCSEWILEYMFFLRYISIWYFMGVSISGKLVSISGFFNLSL